MRQEPGVSVFWLKQQYLFDLEIMALLAHVMFAVVGFSIKKMSSPYISYRCLNQLRKKSSLFLLGQQGDLEHLGTVPFFIPPVFPQAMVAKIGAGIRSHSDSAWAKKLFFSVERLCSTQTSHHLKRGGFQELPDQIIPQNDPFWE